MPSENQGAPVGKVSLWAGYLMSALPALFLLMDAIMKFVQPEPVLKATQDLGYPESSILGLGIVLLSCTVLYLIPRTAVLGAILLTGYLGGAVAAHVRHEDGLFPILFPVIFGALLWGGLYLRDERLRSIIPWRS
jgi:DoxX-like family